MMASTLWCSTSRPGSRAPADSTSASSSGISSQLAIVAAHKLSPDAAFQRDRDQLLRLDREFHRQLLQHVLDEAVDHERGRLLRRQPALPAIEQHLLGDLRGRRLVLE